MIPLAALALFGFAAATPYPYTAPCVDGEVNAVVPNYLEDDPPRPIEFCLHVFRRRDFLDPLPLPSEGAQGKYMILGTYCGVFNQERAYRLSWLIRQCGFVAAGMITENPGMSVARELLYVDIRARWFGTQEAVR